MEVDELFERFTDAPFGFPQPRWDDVYAHLSDLPEAGPRLHAEFVERWVRAVAAAMRPEGHVTWSESTLVVCSDADRADELVAFFDSLLTRIAAILPELVDLEAVLPLYAFVFSDNDQYLSYIEHFDAGGEIIASEGMCLDTGFPHFVQRQRELLAIQSTAAHEIVHFCLTPYPIPLWLNDGLATTLEAVLMAQPALTLAPERLVEHRAFWTAETIQGFWNGAAFAHPESAELAYELARMCVKTLGGDQGAFADFAKAAHWADAGQSAAQEVYGRPIEGLIHQFFGPGEWTPRPESW